MSREFWVGPYDDPDRIQLRTAVASGSEGVLYRAVFSVGDGDGDVDVAVKMLHPAHLGDLPRWANRWEEQGDLLRKIAAPGLVAVRDGFVGPLPHLRDAEDASTASLYLVMDWVEGVALDRWARAVEAAEPEQLLLPLVPVAAALDVLHSGAAANGVSVIHGDVKPSNILVRSGGDTVLVDLGSVHGIRDGTRPSGVIGTPGYIAPEVRHDARYGPAADRYALGAVALFLMTRAEPPIDADVAELRRRLAAAPLLRDRRDLVEHLVTMLDPVPERRPENLANWVAQLRRSSLAVLPGDIVLPPRAHVRHPGRRRSLRRSAAPSRRLRLALWAVVAVLAVVSLLASTVYVGWRRDRTDSAQRAAATKPTAPPTRAAPVADQRAVDPGDRWSEVEAPPVHPDLALSTGDAYVIFNISGDGQRLAAHKLEVATRAWTPLPETRLKRPDPEKFMVFDDMTIAGALGARAVWTGREALVWTALGGAALDVAGGTWRPLPQAPFDAAAGAWEPVWTGQELLLVGASAPDPNVPGATAVPRAAAFDPATNRWRSLPTPPQPPKYGSPQVFWTGTHVLVWYMFAPSGAMFDVGQNRWTSLPAGPEVWDRTGSGDVQVNYWKPVWTGMELLVWGERGVAAFSPDTRSWRTAKAPPATLADRIRADAVWTGAELLIVGGGTDGAGMNTLQGVHQDPVAYDPTRDSWRYTPLIPVPLGDKMPAVIVGTGNVLVVPKRNPQPATAALYITPPVLAPTTACPREAERRGVRCFATMRGDLDGSGSVDEIALYSALDARGNTRQFARVLVGTALSNEVDLTLPGPPQDIQAITAAEVDPVPGVEGFVHTGWPDAASQGPSYRSVSILTYRAGKLVLVPPVDGSVVAPATFHMRDGFRCDDRSRRSVTVTWTTGTATGGREPRLWYEQDYRWDGIRLVPASKRSGPLESDEASARYSGFDCGPASPAA